MTAQFHDFRVGERFPFIAGARADGTFYSLDGQAGRPVVLLLAGKLPQERVLPWLRAFESAQQHFSDRNSDAVVLASAGNVRLVASARDNAGSVPIVFCACDRIFALWPAIAQRPVALVLDRSGRLLSVIDSDDCEAAVAQAIESICRLAPQSGRSISAAAPVLIVPHLIDREFCQALIAHFEAGPHSAGVMASANNAGAGYAKLDTAKKHRRDLVLEPRDALHGQVVDMLARRLVPEIKRAFQADIAHLDRILIARYDDSGGYFRRHRDDAAPHIAYRQFALTLNLNTGDYEGGDLVFPEFSDDRVSPPAGGAAVFSASLLHEAMPVTRGRRYVLLTFLHTREAEARRLAQLQRVA